jgi:hypothetical protein
MMISLSIRTHQGRISGSSRNHGVVTAVKRSLAMHRGVSTIAAIFDQK